MPMADASKPLGYAQKQTVVRRAAAGIAKKLAREDVPESEIHQRMPPGVPLRLNVRFLPDMVPLGTIGRDGHLAATVDSVTPVREPKGVVGGRERQTFPDSVLNARARVHDVGPAELIGSAELVMRVGKQRGERSAHPA